jgi:hypothetical protein
MHPRFILGRQATSMIDIVPFGNGGIAALMDSSSLFNPAAQFNFNHPGFDFLQDTFDGKQFFDPSIKREEMNEYLPAFVGNVNHSPAAFGEFLDI